MTPKLNNSAFFASEFQTKFYHKIDIVLEKEGVSG
jgi:hypothetical protein